MRRPLIGITCNLKAKGAPEYGTKGEVHLLKEPYVKAVLKAGGHPLLIPAQDDPEAIPFLLDLFHGLVVSGGGDDVHPSFYGEGSHPHLGETYPKRNAFEVALVREALQRDLPLLGICGGHQVLNVAAGGSLIQDIPSQLNGSLCHRPTDGSRDYEYHDVLFEGSSRLADIAGTGRARVNSSHHQCVKTLAPGFKAAALAEDGVIEAIEGEDFRFAVGVQWHPEVLYGKEPTSTRLIEAFLRTALDERKAC